MGQHASAPMAVQRATEQLGAQQAFAWTSGTPASTALSDGMVCVKLPNNILNSGRVQRIWLPFSDSVDVNEIKRSLLPKLFGSSTPAEISDDPDLFVRVLFKNDDIRYRPRLFLPIPGHAGAVPHASDESISFGHHFQAHVLKLPASEQRKQLTHEYIPSSDLELATKLVDLLYPNLYLVDGSRSTESAPTQTMLHHPNLMPVLTMLESDDSFFLVCPHYQFTLADMIRFRQGGILQSVTRRLFVVYQIVKVLEHLHSNGLTLGSLSIENVFIDDLLWVRIMPVTSPKPSKDNRKPVKVQPKSRTNIPRAMPDDHPTERWLRGDLSNFEYLLLINHAAGRRFGNPVFHPALPWVIELSAARFEDERWRDLTRTKFRLTKGDEQLDITFDSSVPHHITDILTDITYYVYMARRTPVSVLRRHVRTKYEPNEYPKDMVRLYQWTPDECIPEFFTDATIFTSIHLDMPDLQLPSWATSPEDFVQKHRLALESDQVSMNLHHWIDLTFGYKLSGRYAVEAKNVPLSISDGGTGGRSLKYGIVQLFREPHPARLLSTAARISVTAAQGSDLKAVVDDQRAGSAAPLSTEAPFVDRVAQFLFNPINLPKKVSTMSPSTSTAGLNALTAGLQQHLPSNKDYSNSDSSQHQIKVASTAVISPHELRKRSGNVAFAPTQPPTTLDQHKRITSTAHRRYVFPAFAQIDPILQQQYQEASASSMPLLGVLTGSSGASTNEWQLVDRAQLTSQTISHGTLTQASLANLATPTTVIPLTARGIEPDMFLGALNRVEAAQAFERRHAQLLQADTEQSRLPSTHEPMMASFEELCAHDLALLGQLIEDLFVEEPTDTAPNACPLHKHAKDFILPSFRMPQSLAILVDRLKHPIWQRRPSAQDILTGVLTDALSPVFSSHLSIAYDFLSQYVRAGSWSARLDLAKREMADVCAMPNETLDVVLPSLLALFRRSETKVAAITLVDRLGSRLGPHKARSYLMKPFLALFETQREDVYRQLLREHILEQLISRFGMREIVKQLVPFLLEGLVVDAPAPNTTGPADNLTARSLAMPPSPRGSKIDMSEGEGVAALASRLILTVSLVIGPILTAKHISVPLLRRLFTEAGSSTILLHTLSSLGSQFGETFIIIHFFPALFTTLESHASKPLSKSGVVVCNVLSLVEKLVLQIPAVSLVNLIDGQLGGIIRSFLTPLPKQPRLDHAGRAAISRKTIELLVYISHSISRMHWEKRILPILLNFFMPFNDIYAEPTQTITAMAQTLGSITTDVTGDSDRPLKIVQATDEELPIYTPEMAYYAYFQFCQLIGQETMRRYIPNSDLIERLMYQHMTSGSSASDGAMEAARATVASTNTLAAAAAAAATDLAEQAVIIDSSVEDATERFARLEQALSQEGEMDEEGGILSETSSIEEDQAGLVGGGEEDDFAPLPRFESTEKLPGVAEEQEPIKGETNTTGGIADGGSNMHQSLSVESSPVSIKRASASDLTSGIRESQDVQGSISHVVDLSSSPLQNTLSATLTGAAAASSSSLASTVAAAAAATAAAAAASSTAVSSPSPTKGFLASPTPAVYRSGMLDSPRASLPSLPPYNATAPPPLSRTTNSPMNMSAKSSTRLSTFAQSGPFWKPNKPPTSKGDDSQPWKDYFASQTDVNAAMMPANFRESKLKVYTGHTAAIRSLAVSNSELRALTASKDKTVKLWSLGIQRAALASGEGGAIDFGECLRTYNGHKRAVFDIMFVHGGRQLWDVETTKLMYHADLSKSNVVSVGHMPRMALVVAAMSTGTLQFLDYKSRNLKQTWRTSQGVSGVARVVAVDPVNNELIALGFSTGAISLLDARTGMVLTTWKAHDGEVSQIVFIESDSIVSAGTDGSLVQWDVSRAAIKSSFKGVGDTSALHYTHDNVFAVNSSNTMHFFGLEKTVRHCNLESMGRKRGSAEKESSEDLATTPTAQSAPRRSEKPGHVHCGATSSSTRTHGL